MLLLWCISLFCKAVNHRSPRGKEYKSGKTQLKGNQFSPMLDLRRCRAVSWDQEHCVVHLLFKEDHRGETICSTSSPLRSLLSFAAWEKQTNLLPPEPAMFYVSTIKQVTVFNRSQPSFQTLNSIITEADSSSPPVHWVWLILCDLLLAAFVIFMSDLTSLWDGS